MLEHLTGHPMGPSGRELVAFAGQLAPAAAADADAPADRAGRRRPGRRRAGDRIELRGLRGRGHPRGAGRGAERAQPFEIDLDLAVDLAPAGGSDDLADTVDYGAVADVAAAVVAGPAPFDLLEALAGAVAEAVLGLDPRSRAVTVHRAQAATRRCPSTSTPSGCGSPAAGDRPVRPERPPVRAFLGLGSNLGDRWAHLRRAVDQLRAGQRSGGHGRLPVYETEPVGGPDGPGPVPQRGGRAGRARPPTPTGCSSSASRLEAAAGRVRTVRWGPRTLDADVLVDRRAWPSTTPT